MQTDIITDFLPVLPNVPEGGMIYYLQTEAMLRGRRHQNTFFCTFNGGEKSVFDFFRDQTLEIVNRLALLQSWDVQYFGYLFVKLFPLPYVIQFIPYPIFGFWTEPATESKNLGIVAFKTEQQGRRSWFRKLLFGMPATWNDGKILTPEGSTRIFAHASSWAQLWHPSYTDWPYTMGKMDRYIGGSYHSPLNPINYWPLDRMIVRPSLVKHKHPKANGH